MITQDTPDVITQDQASLESPETATATEAPQYVTADEFKAMQSELTRKVESAERETRGLQARVDRDRADLQRQEHLRAAQVRKSRLESQMGMADETSQPLFESQIATENERIAQLNQSPPQPQPATNGTETSPEWEPVYEIVRNLGLDPKDDRIDYSPLTRPGIADNARLGTFMSGVRPLIGASPEPAASPQASPQATQQRPTVSPPTDGSPTTSGALSGGHETRIAFIEGKINMQQYQERMTRLGLPS